MKNNKYGRWIKISVIGSYCPEYLNSLIDEIKIWDAEIKDSTAHFKTFPHNYLLAARKAKKFQLRCSIEERHGLSYKFTNYKRRWAFVSGGLLFMLTAVIASGIVWDIRISGNNNVSSKQLLEALDKCGIRGGVPLTSFDTTTAELKIRLDIPELSWISIEREGCIINVKVYERLSVETAEIPMDMACNVISEQDAVIISMEVYSGQAKTAVGSGIDKEGILVSGVFEDGGGNVVYRHASAKIIGEYSLEKEFYLPFESTEKVFTGESEKHDYLSLYQWEIPLFSDDKFGIEGVYSEETRRISFFSYYLPLKITTVTCREQKDITVVRSTDDVKKILENRMTSYENTMLADAEIVEREKTYEADEKGIKLHVTYTLRSDISSQKPIYTKISE